jgi:hypothetical protein
MSTRVRKKEILSDDFKKRKIFWKNIAENFPPHITTLYTHFQATLCMTRELATPFCSLRTIAVQFTEQSGMSKGITRCNKTLIVFKTVAANVNTERYRNDSS